MAAWVLSVFSTRSTEILLTLYKSVVRCHLEFCCPLWNPHKVADIEELESVQRAFTAKIAGLSDLHYWDRLKHLSLMSLQRRRERYIVIHMWKIYHGLTSNDLKICFESNIRHGILAKVPPIHKGSSTRHQTLYEMSFGVMGPKLWNCVPKHVRSHTKLESFKGDLTRYMLQVPDKPPIKGFTAPNRNSILDWRAFTEVSSLRGGWEL